MRVDQGLRPENIDNEEYVTYKKEVLKVNSNIILQGRKPIRRHRVGVRLDGNKRQGQYKRNSV